MKEHDPLKAATEVLTGFQDTWKVLNSMVRVAERRAGEAEVELNALLKARGAIGSLVKSHQRNLIELRTAAEAEAKKPEGST